MTHSAFCLRSPVEDALNWSLAEGAPIGRWFALNPSAEYAEKHPYRTLVGKLGYTPAELTSGYESLGYLGAGCTAAKLTAQLHHLGLDPAHTVLVDRTGRKDEALTGQNLKWFRGSDMILPAAPSTNSCKPNLPVMI